MDNERYEILAASVIIGIGRLYDVMLCLLAESNSKMAEDLRVMHEQGKMFFPPPAIEVDDDSN